ncbi:hypothetical protein M422DRAFT_63896 [Sphaerobolus stellatus SS14]|nr:hypothetical protein M422DRAFT_63896 [Sphaerobolus stellatus SS14]
MNCKYYPCRWNESGCTFRGSLETVASHETYTDTLHEEFARLKRIYLPSILPKCTPTREDGDKGKNATSLVNSEISKSIEPRTLESKPKSRKIQASCDIPVDEYIVIEEPISEHGDDEEDEEKPARPSKKKKSERKKQKKAAEQSDTDDEKRVRKAEKAKRREERRAERAAAKASESNAEQSEAISPEIEDSSSTHTSAKDQKKSGSAASNHSHISSSPPSATTCNQVSERSGSTKGSKLNNNLTVTGASTDSVPSRPSALKKRDPEEAGLDSTISSSGTPKKKKVRIRLPSPFLQPDTDEEEAEGTNGKEGTNVQDSGDDSEEWDELMITDSAASERKPSDLKEEVEVATSVVTPTPASLLAKYHASKPKIQQAQNHFDPNGQPARFPPVSQPNPYGWHVPQLGQSFSAVNATPKPYNNFVSPIMLNSLNK